MRPAPAVVGAGLGILPSEENLVRLTKLMPMVGVGRCHPNNPG